MYIEEKDFPEISSNWGIFLSSFKYRWAEDDMHTLKTYLAFLLEFLEYLVEFGEHLLIFFTYVVGIVVIPLTIIFKPLILAVRAAWSIHKLERGNLYHERALTLLRFPDMLKDKEAFREKCKQTWPNEDWSDEAIPSHFPRR